MTYKILNRHFCIVCFCFQSVLCNLLWSIFTTVVIATVMSRLVKVSIVGTAGRNEDGKKLTKEIYHLMYEKAKDIIVNKFKLELSQCHAVSGGAAWASRTYYLLIMFKVV